MSIIWRILWRIRVVVAKFSVRNRRSPNDRGLLNGSGTSDYRPGSAPSRGHASTSSNVIGSVLKRPRRDSATHKNRIGPSAIPLWQERAWKKNGNILSGAYRTRRGGFFGEIILRGGDAGNFPSFYVIAPPKGVLTSPHSACYRHRGGSRYWVHFNRAASVDAGIAELEAQLTQYED